jgi:predicted nucleotidyltransferase
MRAADPDTGSEVRYIGIMKRDEVLALLKSVEPALRAQGVEALYLFGSHARDEARPESDIDVLVDFQSERGVGLSEYMAPYHVLERAFPGVDIGYGTRDGIVAHYKPHIETSALRVF